MYNQEVGRFGENLAKEFLEKNGYKIIEMNVKTSYKELDIIAEKDDEIIFVEVKTRTSNSFGSAEEAVYSKKLYNLKRAAGIYLGGNKSLGEKEPRIDLIAIDLDKFNKSAKIKHYKGIT